jgi:hypothetical protein
VLRADQSLTLGAVGPDDPRLLAAWQAAARVVEAEENVRNLGRVPAVLGTLGLIACLYAAISPAYSCPAVLIVLVAMVPAVGYWCWFAPSVPAVVALTVLFGLAALVSLVAVVGVFLIPWVVLGIIAAAKLARAPEASPIYVEQVAAAMRDTAPRFLPSFDMADVATIRLGARGFGHQWRLKLRPEIAIAVSTSRTPLRVVAIGRSEATIEPCDSHSDRAYTIALGEAIPRGATTMQAPDFEKLRAWLVGG